MKPKQTTNLRTVKLTIEFNGAQFAGWQEQPGLRTVQGELIRVLTTILRSPVLQLSASGRTDAGVHARAQVVSFKTSADLTNLGSVSYGVTSLLRGEVSVLSASVVEDDFHARFSPHRKQYSYRIFTRNAAPILEKDFVWHVRKSLDLQKMKESAKYLSGEHDFTSLRSADCVAISPIRIIDESEIIESENELVYRVVAKGFLKQMVRNIAGTLVGIGLGRIAGRDMPQILAAKNRSAAGVTAPPQGLILDWVRYS